jgi:general secretion pathway protein A
LSRDESVAVIVPCAGFRRPFGLLKRICEELGIQPCRSTLDYMMALEKYLLELHKNGQYVVIFLDEAEYLDTYMLDLVRQLLNFETTDTGKLIQFVMSGNIGLYDRLTRKRNRALRSRVLYMNFLEPFTLAETVEMLCFRCDRLNVPVPFTATAMEKIHELSKGVPRLILTVASAAYDLRHLATSDKLDADFVSEAYRTNEKPDNVEVIYG